MRVMEIDCTDVRSRQTDERGAPMPNEPNANERPQMPETETPPTMSAASTPANNATNVPSGTFTQGSLGAFWTARRSGLVTGYQKPLTQREYGQLKYLERCLGDRTRPVITYAVKNWLTFAVKARAVAGLATFPTAPHIGFLLKHHAVVVELMKPMPSKPKVTTASSKVTKAPVVKREPPHRLTKEELVEMLAGLKQ
jgi:hypothetical protein